MYFTTITSVLLEKKKQTNDFSSVSHHPSWNSCALLVASMSIVLFVIGSYQMTSNAIPTWPFWFAYNYSMEIKPTR
jgi:hypothetical protein